MTSLNTSVTVAFYNPAQVPNRITSQMIHDVDLPLSPGQKWKQPFVLDQNPILAERIQAALSRGPFVAEASVGPKFYNGEPSQFQGVISDQPELSVYGWKPEQRKSDVNSGTYQEIIICGVQKQRIYYLLARELTTDWPLGRTEHQKTSDKIYTVSVEKFSEYLFNMYPPAQKEDNSIDPLRQSRILEYNKMILAMVNNKIGT